MAEKNQAFTKYFNNGMNVGIKATFINKSKQGATNSRYLCNGATSAERLTQFLDAH